MKWSDLLCVFLCLGLFNLNIYTQTSISNSGQDMFDYASLLQARGYGDSAITYYTKAYGCNSELLCHSWVNIAQIHCFYNRYDSCNHYINLIKSKFPESIYKYNLLAMETYMSIYNDKSEKLLEMLKVVERGARERGDSILLARTFFYLGDYYFYNNNYSKALLYYDDALRLHLQLHVLTIETTLYIENIAYINKLFNNLVKTIEYQNYSFIIKKYVLNVPKEHYINLFINRGYVFISQYEEYKAIEVFLNAEQMAMEDPSNKKNLCLVLLELGKIFSKLDKHELALSYYNKTLEIIEQMGDTKLLGEIYDRIAYSYYDMNELNKALDYFQRSIFIKQASGLKDFVYTYKFMAKVYFRLGDNTNAEKFYLMAIDNGIHNYGKDSKQQLKSFYDYITLLLYTKRYEEAYSYIIEGKRIAQIWYGDNHYGVSKFNLRLGDYYYLMGKYNEALESYHNSILTFFNNYEPNSYFDIPEEKYLPHYEYAAECLAKKANSLMKIGLQMVSVDSTNIYFKSAMENYSLALKVIDLLKFEYKDLDFSLLLSEDFKPIFDNAANASILAYNTTHDTCYLHYAWMFSEANKATLIKAMYTEKSARELLDVPTQFQELESGLKNKIALSRNLIEKEKEKRWPDKNKISIWNAELLESFTILDSIASLLREDYPAYFDLKYNTDITKISQVQSKLNNDQILIEYFIADTSIIVFALNNDTICMFNSPLDSNFLSLANLFSKYFRSGQPDYTLNGFTEYCNTSFQLYSILLAPFEELIKDKSIIVIPDDIISLIPFEALVTNDVQLDYVDFKNISYLVNQNSVLYEYSASFVGNSIKKSHKAPKVIALVPEYSEDVLSKSAELKDESSDLKSLKPLIGASGEVGSISRIYKTKKLLSKEANERNLYDMADEYSILHIAGHTLINDNKPMFSKLVLTIQNDTTNDNLLNTYELYNHFLGNKLVVLSGCNTGVGKLRKGEGMISLARGFIFAGCQSIVMTLWSISDNSSAELMAEFYKNMAKGKNKDEALQQAKALYLKQADPLKAHPYYWAGYICIGDNEALPRRFNGIWYIFISLGGIMGFLLFRFIQKRN